MRSVVPARDANFAFQGTLESKMRAAKQAPVVTYDKETNYTREPIFGPRFARTRWANPPKDSIPPRHCEEQGDEAIHTCRAEEWIGRYGGHIDQVSLAL
jgi:hypothetical protein